MRPQRSRLQPGEADELQLEIERLHHALDDIEDCPKTTPRHVLAGELPQDLRCQALAKPICYLMDPLHMLAYRAEPELASARVNSATPPTAPVLKHLRPSPRIHGWGTCLPSKSVPRNFEPEARVEGHVKLPS